MYELFGCPATWFCNFPTACCCISEQRPYEGINPITSREVKQIEAQKQPEMVYSSQQQAVSYVQFAKNNVYPLNDKLYSHLCQKKFK